MPNRLAGVKLARGGVRSGSRIPMSQTPGNNSIHARYLRTLLRAGRRYRRRIALLRDVTLTLQSRSNGLPPGVSLDTDRRSSLTHLLPQLVIQDDLGQQPRVLSCSGIERGRFVVFDGLWPVRRACR